MNKKRISSAVLAAVIACSCLPAGVSAAENYQYKDVIFSGIEVNGGDVIRGVDISSVIALEDSGVVFRNENGEKQDVFQTLKNAGVNYVRVRVWNDPYSSQGKTYGGGNNDINTAVKIAERCSRYGLKMLVDFHYSDFWADPGKQIAPKAWRYYSLDQKEQAIKEFTYSSLEKISQTGAEIGMVQIGNETNTGMAGETDWQNVCRLMNAGSSAVRRFDSSVLVAVHFTNPEKQNWHMTLAGYLDKYKVDYDVFATSYYPYWHGTLSNLTNVMRQVSSKYGKYVMVAETSWANTYNDADQFPNTIDSQDKLGSYVSYDVSVQGQINAVTDVFSAVAASGSKGIGAFYWEPAWLAVGKTKQECTPLWETYGSGWATYAAGEYQDDAAKYYGGSAVDNQALFSQDGKPLASLYLYSHIRSDGVSDKENLIENPGFDKDRYSTDQPAGWKLYNTTSGEYSKFTVNDEMPMSGAYSLHWYSPNAFSGSSAYSEITAAKTGKYEFSFYAAGENSTCTANILVNGNKVSSSSCTVSAYDRWDESVCEFSASAGDRISIEINVSGGAESYGSVDNCQLYLSEEGTGTEAGPGQEELKGDTDGDGKISASDILALKKYMFGQSDLDEKAFARSDINDDTAVNIADYILLAEMILGQY